MYENGEKSMTQVERKPGIRDGLLAKWREELWRAKGAANAFPGPVFGKPVNSLILNHNIPVIVVSRRLGHAKPSITLDVYGHLIPSMQFEAAQKIDELITPVEVNHLHPTAPDLHQKLVRE